MASVNEKLGARIRELRRQRNITLEELAFQTKTDYSYLQQIESGKRNPSVKRIAAIADILKVRLTELFDF
jgi:transcriptional regulator with XRE-family HTH domain